MLIKMLCAIPEEIGWVIVGAMGAYAIMWAHKLGKLFVEMWKERHEEDED